MEDFSIEAARTALVLIDLQHSNVERELAPYSGEQVVGNCVLLAQEMRIRNGTVMYVRVLLNEMLALPADTPMSPAPGAEVPPPNASQLVPEAGVEATDIVIEKRQWGAFYGTELDQLLRRKHIKTILLGGIATNLGVESTAREAFDRGYELVFAEDAMSGLEADAHNVACHNVLRKMGRVRSTQQLLKLLRAGTGEA